MTTPTEAVVEALFDEMSDRSGFDALIDSLDDETRGEWKETWARLLASHLAAAESRGYERAREQAEGIAERCRKERETLAKNEWAATRPATAQASLEGKWSEAERIRDDIRAMTDERARGEGTMCCRRCGEPIEKGPQGTWRHPAQTDDGHIALP